MAFTFDADQEDPISRVRFVVGDISQAKPLLDDAFYTAALRLANDNEAAATQAIAGHLAVVYAQKPDTLDGVKWSERVTAWRLIAQDTAVAKTSATTSAASNRPRVAQLAAGSEYRVR